MTNWRDPNTILQNSLSVVKLTHVIGGIFIWEWVTTLNFELGLLSHQVEWSVAMLTYVLCRFVTMGVVVCDFVLMSVTEEVNCGALMRVTLAFASLSFAFAPCIIVLRVIAIWNRNKIAILSVSVVYLLNFSLLIRFIIKAGQDSLWDPASSSCVVADPTITRLSGTASFVSDICLLVVMLIGIWRAKAPGNIWKRLYHQGVIWVLIATISYAPMVTFLWLDLNSAMSEMFLMPTCVILAICATRMHRDLYTFGRRDQNEVISFSSMISWRVRAGGTAGENLMPMACLNTSPSQENGGTQEQYITRDMDSVDGKNPPICDEV